MPSFDPTLSTDLPPDSRELIAAVPLRAHGDDETTRLRAIHEALENELAATREKIQQEIAAAEVARLRWETQSMELAVIRSQLESTLQRASSAEQGWETKSAQMNADPSPKRSAETDLSSPTSSTPMPPALIANLRRQLEREKSATVYARQKLEAESARMEESRRQLDAESAHWSEARKAVQAEGEQLNFALEQIRRDREDTDLARREWESQTAQVAALRIQLEQQLRQAVEAALKLQADSTTSSVNSSPTENVNRSQSAAGHKPADDHSEPVIPPKGSNEAGVDEPTPVIQVAEVAMVAPSSAPQFPTRLQAGWAIVLVAMLACTAIGMLFGAWMISDR